MNKKHIYRNILKALVFGGLSLSGFSAVSSDKVSTTTGSAVAPKTQEQQDKVNKAQDNKKTDKQQVVDLPVTDTTADPDEVL